MMTEQTEPSAAQQRLLDIEKLQASAVGLLEAAKHETLREEIRRAIGDLDQARGPLIGGKRDPHPSTLFYSDLYIRLAATRLQELQEWVRQYGPDAMLLE